MNHNTGFPMWAASWLVLLAVGTTSAVENTTDRLARVEQMSASQRNALKRNQERLESLPAENQLRLRELERQLDADPAGDRLRALMVRYHEWLQSLPSGERAELLSLPAEQRLPKIQEMMTKYETARLREQAKEALTPEDSQLVKKWFGEIVKLRRDKLIELLPPSMREVAKTEEDPRRLMNHVFWNRENPGRPGPGFTMSDPLQITEQERKVLVDTLSPAARKVYSQAPNEDQRKEIVQFWIFSSVFFQRLTSEELQAFLKSKNLPASERDRIENLPPDQMRAELVRLYFQRRMGQDGKRSPFFPPGKGRGGPSRP